MSEPTQSDHDLVLDAIDVISARKNRPNIARIYRHLVRSKSITSAVCEKLLEELVERGRVMKVTYKGNISYRNAAKWKNINRHKAVAMKAQKRGSSFLSGSVAELLVRSPTYFQNGVPCKILEDHLMAKDARFTKESIHKMLQKELQQETLVQLDNGNYYLSMYENSNTNSTVSEDSDSNETTPAREKVDESSKDKDGMRVDLMVRNEVHDDNSNEEDDGSANALQKEQLDDDEEEEGEEEGYKTADEARDESEPRSPALSGESDDESKSRSRDEDYLPPYHVLVKKNDGSGSRMARRSKKTRYDASEYVFPSLKRSYKAKEKMVVSKPAKKVAKDFTSKEPNKSELQKVSSTNASNQNYSFKKKSDILLCDRQLTRTNLSNLLCCICNNSSSLALKSNSTRCKLCKRKAHRKCAEKDQASAKLEVDLLTWTCANCRFIISQPCSVCHHTVSSAMGPLVICSNCRLSYHRCCHDPAIPKQDALTGSWRCAKCPSKKKTDSYNHLPKIGTITTQKIASEPGRFEQVFIQENEVGGVNVVKGRTPLLVQREKKVSYLKINDSSATRPQQQQRLDKSSEAVFSPLPTPCSSQDTIEITKDVVLSDEHQLELKYKTETIASDIPDSSSWTPSDVYNYFKEHFNEYVATAFFKQEIDGNSLKLLRRSDVLRGLNFKLGLGLNVLYRVRMLQLRTSDLKLLWKPDS